MGEPKQQAQALRQYCLQAMPEQEFRTEPIEKLMDCLDAVAYTKGGHDRTAEDFRRELDRRALQEHSERIETYADRLDLFTRGLLGLTLVIVLQTAVIVALEVESHYPKWGVPAGALTAGIALGMYATVTQDKNRSYPQWLRSLLGWNG